MLDAPAEPRIDHRTVSEPLVIAVFEPEEDGVADPGRVVLGGRVSEEIVAEEDVARLRAELERRTAIDPRHAFEQRLRPVRTEVLRVQQVASGPDGEVPRPLFGDIL